MNFEQAGVAWFSLDQLFTATSLRKKLELAIADETGFEMVYQTLAPLISETPIDEWEELSKDWLILLYGTAAVVLRELDSEAKKKIPFAIAKLNQSDKQLRKSFTREELEQFIEGVESGTEWLLNDLDKQTGSYLVLKCIELIQSERKVLEMLFEGFERTEV